MPRSIARRIHRIVFAISLLSLLLTVGMAYLAYRDMEQTMLALENQAERDFLLDHIGTNIPLTWETAHLKAFYVPPGQSSQTPPQTVFHELAVPFSGEVEVGNQTYLVSISEAGGGSLYIAKNISLFERREALFAILLAIIAVGVIVLSFVLARVSSRRLVMPLQQLADQIGGTLPGQRMTRLPLRFEDAELATIATTFNRFLDELEAYVKREQSLLGLASHELRTPIAVIAGALDVMDQRGQLCADDRHTLHRAQRASAEMGTNVDVVLKLVRRKEHVEQSMAIDLSVMTRELLDDLDPAIAALDRVVLEVTEDVSVVADPVLVKMLLRNLIQNSLQHTSSTVLVRLEPDCVEISDQGGGLPEAYQQLLVKRELPATEISALSGLGLFIVTLICERLEWQLQTPRNSTQGTTIRLRFGNQP